MPLNPYQWTQSEDIRLKTALRDMRVSRGTIVPSDTQRLAGDIVHLLGGKAQYGIGDLARLADPAHRN